MKIINLTFISLPSDIVNFIQSELTDSYLYVLVDNSLSELSRISCDVLSKGRYLLIVSNSLLNSDSSYTLDSLEREYPNLLFFRVGRLEEKTLEESWTYTLKISDDEEMNKKWNSLINRYKKNFSLGGFVATDDGYKKYSKNIRLDKKLLNNKDLLFFPMYTHKFFYIFQ